MKPKMHLAFDLSYTHLDGRWRVPGSWTGRVYPDVGIYEEVARIAERGCIDMIFFGDGTGIPNTWRGSEEQAVRWGIQWPRHDVSPWIPLMARATSHVGFCLTYASTFMHPFYTARLLNSLDHVTNGRIAFNVITSTRRADAANYGFDELMEHDLRYDRMEEFVDVCKALMEQRRAGCLRVESRIRRGGRPRKGAPDQPCRPVLQGARTAQCGAVAAGPAGADPGRLVTARHQGVRRLFAGHVFASSQALNLPASAIVARARCGACRRGARPGQRRYPVGHLAGGRRDRAGGACRARRTS